MAPEPTEIRDAIEIAAWAVAMGAASLLALALAGETVRRNRPSARLVRIVDRLTPAGGRRIALAILAVISTVIALAGPRGAGAEPDIRRWLTTDDAVATTPTQDNEPGPGPRAAETPPTSAPGARREWLTDPPRPGSGPGAGTGPEVPPTSRARRPEPRDAATPSSTTSSTTAASTTTSTPRQSTAGAAPAIDTPTVATDRAPRPTPAIPDAAPEDAPPTATHTVVPGDCLWSIAAARLGRAPSVLAIDRGWRAIYAANLGVIGDDPNLIHPGTVLTVPRLDPTH
jgi:hypothetical protein